MCGWLLKHFVLSIKSENSLRNFHGDRLKEVKIFAELARSGALKISPRQSKLVPVALSILGKRSEGVDMILRLWS
jgi:hypothetical protein